MPTAAAVLPNGALEVKGNVSSSVDRLLFSKLAKPAGSEEAPVTVVVVAAVGTVGTVGDDCSLVEFWRL